MAAMTIVFCVSWDCVKPKNNLVCHFNTHTAVNQFQVAQKILETFHMGKNIFQESVYPIKKFTLERFFHTKFFLFHQLRKNKSYIWKIAEEF